MEYRRLCATAIMLLLLVAVDCGGGDSDDPVGIMLTPELAELVSPLVLDTQAETILTPTLVTIVPTVDPLAELFSINQLICLQMELGGNMSTMSSALEGTSALSLQALRSLHVCTGSTSILLGEAPEFSIEQIDCVIERGDIETLQNLSAEETQALGRTFVECGIIEFDPLALDPSPGLGAMGDIAPTTIPPATDPLGAAPSFFAHSDPDCVAERAGQSTVRLIRKATDIRSLEYQVGIATFCLDSNLRSIPNYLAPTAVPGVTVCQNAFLALQALINSEIENPLLLTLGLSQVDSKCEFDEMRLLVFSG